MKTTFPTAEQVRRKLLKTEAVNAVLAEVERMEANPLNYPGTDPSTCSKYEELIFSAAYFIREAQRLKSAE